MKYIKKYNNTILEAPYILEKDGKKIYGYNKEANEKMLLKDGYLKYNGSLSTFFLDIIDGKITRKDIEDDRRALAQHQLKYAYLWMENVGATVKYEEEFMAILN